MHCCAIKADFALCAVVVSKNKPNIVDPLPLMLAKKAPCLYNCDFISANSGNCVKILYSKSLNNKSFIFEQSSFDCCKESTKESIKESNKYKIQVKEYYKNAFEIYL